MSSQAAYPIPTWEGLVTAVQKTYIRPLRQPLAMFRIFAGREVRAGQWWNTHLQRWHVSDVDGSFTLTEDVPPFQSTEGGTLRAEQDPLPMKVDDFSWGGRRGKQFEQAGLDVEFMAAKGRATARGWNKLLAEGTGDANMFGPSTGLFDISGGTTAGGNWEDPDTLDGDLQAAFEDVADRGDEYAEAGAFLVMDPSDRSLVTTRVPNTSPTRRVFEDFPPGIRAPLFDSNVGTGNAFLISDSEAAGYHTIAPENDPASGFSFGLGRSNLAAVENSGDGVLVGNRAEIVDAITIQRKVRFMNIMGTRFERTGTESPVQKLTFTRA